MIASTLVVADKAVYQGTVLRGHIDRYKYTFALEMEAFVGAVRAGDAVPPRAAGLADGVQNMKICRACALSLATNARVAV